MDLIEHGGGEDGEDFPGVGGGGFRLCQLGVPPHLRVGVGGEVGDYLVGGDANFDGTLDGLFGHFASDEVGVAGAEVGEEGEEGGLQWGGGVGVDAVVGFDYDEAVGVGGGGGGEGGGQAGVAAGAGGVGVGGQCCGQAGWVEVGRVGGGLVDDAEVGEVREDSELVFVQMGFAVGLAELEGGDEE